MKADTLEKKVKKLEDDYKKNDYHNLFKTVRDLEGLPKKTLNIIKDNEGKKQSDTSTVLNLWKEHFENHLNTLFPHNEAAIDSIVLDDSLINAEEPAIQLNEIKHAIKKMKKRKTPGNDLITTEVIIAGGEKMLEILQKIFNTIIKQSKTPTDFSKMLVTPVYKKGNKLLRENYRTIALLSIPGKIFLHILLSRMQGKVNA